VALSADGTAGTRPACAERATGPAVAPCKDRRLYRAVVVVLTVFFAADPQPLGSRHGCSRHETVSWWLINFAARYLPYLAVSEEAEDQVVMALEVLVGMFMAVYPRRDLWEVVLTALGMCMSFQRQSRQRMWDFTISHVREVVNNVKSPHLVHDPSCRFVMVHLSNLPEPERSAKEEEFWRICGSRPPAVVVTTDTVSGLASPMTQKSGFPAP
jgi:hypothetical protein